MVCSVLRNRQEGLLTLKKTFVTSVRFYVRSEQLVRTEMKVYNIVAGLAIGIIVTIER